MNWQSASSMLYSKFFQFTMTVSFIFFITCKVNFIKIIIESKRFDRANLGSFQTYLEFILDTSLLSLYHFCL